MLSDKEAILDRLVSRVYRVRLDKMESVEIPEQLVHLVLGVQRADKALKDQQVLQVSRDLLVCLGLKVKKAKWDSKDCRDSRVREDHLATMANQV